MPPPARAVVFDLFDTLVPGGARSARDALSRQMAEDLGVDGGRFVTVFKGSFRRRWTGSLGPLEQTIAALAVECGGAPDGHAVRRAADRRLAFTRRQITPTPAVLKVLDELRAAGWRLGLVSNCSAEIPLLWPTNPLSRWIEHPVFSCEFGLCKPDPKIFTHAARALRIPPPRCVFVADGAGGELLGAQSAGMRTIRVQANDVDHSTYGAVGPWTGTTVTSLTDLPLALPHP
jgi:putative hydrolase of the HAD superfamily